jgi:SAM-dependent methyltransferase
MTDYDMREHWSKVGERIGIRGGVSLYAGDFTPYMEYKGQQSSARFLPKIAVEGLSVLDVGCGPGNMLKWLHSKGAKRVVGCDQAPGMIEQAKRNTPSDVQVFLTDGDALPFHDGEFDLVMTNTVLQHNPDERRTNLLREICRVSAKSVILMEDTSLVMRPKTLGTGLYQNFYPRPVGWYAGAASTFGLDLVELDYLQTFVSLKVYLYLALLSNRGKVSSSEGAPISPIHARIEKALISITKHIDGHVNYHKGENSFMRYERRG